MRTKAIAGIMLTLFLVSMLTMAFDVNAQSTQCQWEQVNIDGFGDPNNVGAWPCEGATDFDGNVYVGTMNFVTGTEIWTTSDGTTWIQVNEDGFGDPNNVDVEMTTALDGNLYAGTTNEVVGGGVWRTSDGITWTQVNIDGFGDPNNIATFPLVVFQGNLYAGTENEVTGGQIWRSSNGTTWISANMSGFGDKNNVYTEVTVVFENHLYAGTCNEVTGAEVWRTSDGTTWTQVNIDGFGDPNNIFCLPFKVFHGNLYAGTTNEVTGGEIWRTSDGITWTQVNEDDFGDPNNVESYPFLIFKDNLYVTTTNEVTGGEIWRTSDGITWTQVNEDGFGDPNNVNCCANAIMMNYLYAGTYNEVTGGEIWRCSPTVELPTITSITPDHGNQGETLDVIITGTNFDGATEVIFDARITVNSFNVDSSTQITANIAIDQMCEHRPTTISVTTPAGTATLEDGFTVELKKGCFIATAAYGTPVAEEIDVLRDFRDQYLLTNPVGEALVDFYYQISSPIAEFITVHPSLKPLVRVGLVPAVAMSTIAVNTTPAEKTAIVGLLVLVSVALVLWATRRRGRGAQHSWG